MNARERYLAVMNFEPVDRVPSWEFGYWASAVRRWYKEGLPRDAGIPDDMPDGMIARGPGLWWDENIPREEDVSNYFHLDPGMRHIPLNNFFMPKFVPEILEDEGVNVVSRDEWGMVERHRKDLSALAHFIRGPVENRDDWERLKAQRLQPTLEGRLPANWNSLKEEYRVRDYPLVIGGGQGFFGTARRLLGEILVLLVFHDDPQLIRDIMDYLADFFCAIYDQVLNQIDVDAALIWEDMCYKNGPLISPALFEEYMLAPYKKLTGMFRDHGIKAILCDTDGNCWQLISLFMEAGVTGLYPFEVAAGMDVVEVREAFPKLQILGGIDKIAIAKGPEAIDAELEAKIPSMIKLGGFIPHGDHALGPDISWANFKYYRNKLNAMLK